MQSPAYDIAAQTGKPVFMIGPPGTGKTEYTKALAAALDRICIPIVAATREPTDFSGLPFMNPQTGIVSLEAVGKWVKEILEMRDKKFIIFLDELPWAPHATQASLLKLIHEGILGETQLPMDRVQFIACGNPTDQAGGWEMIPPMANRWCWLNWNPTPDSWVQGMIQGWPAPKPVVLPKDWQNFIFNSRTQIASYIQTRPASLDVFPKNEAERSGPWASRRSWDMAATMLCAAESVNASEDIKIELLRGCIGPAGATEFLVWQKALDLIDPEILLHDPSKFKMPKRGDQVYAQLSSVSAAVLQNNTSARWTAAWEVFAIASKLGSPDLVFGAATAIVNHRPAGTPTPKAVVEALAPIMKAIGMLS